MEPPESKPADILVLVPTTSSSRSQGVRAPPPVGRMLGVINGGGGRALNFTNWLFIGFFLSPFFFFLLNCLISVIEGRVSRFYSLFFFLFLFLVIIRYWSTGSRG